MTERQKKNAADIVAFNSDRFYLVPTDKYPSDKNNGYKKSPAFIRQGFILIALNTILSQSHGRS